MDMKTCAIVSLGYLIPAYIFYQFFIIHLFTKKDREFETPFFNIIKLMGIIDLIFIPLTYLTYRIGSFESLYPFYKNFEEKNVLMTIIVYLYCVFQHVQFLAHFLLSLNRLSAVTMINSYNKYWASKHFWKYAATIILLPAIYMSWLLYFGANMSLLPGFNYGIDSFKTGYFWLKKSMFCVVIGGSVYVLSFIMDLITFVHICAKHFIDASMQIRLLAVSTIMLITNIVYMFFTFLYIFPSVAIMDQLTYHIVLIYILDLKSVISPFCNIALNPFLRKSFFHRKSVSRIINIHSSNNASP